MIINFGVWDEKFVDGNLGGRFGKGSEKAKRSRSDVQEKNGKNRRVLETLS